MLSHMGTSVHLPPPLDYCYTSAFWQVQVPYTKSQFQRFRVCLWAIQTHFHSCLLFTPRTTLKCSSSFTLFLSASLSLVLGIYYFFLFILVSCTPQTSLWTTAVSLLGFLMYIFICSCIISRLRYPTLLQLAVLLLFLIQPYSYGWKP